MRNAIFRYILTVLILLIAPDGLEAQSETIYQQAYSVAEIREPVHPVSDLAENKGSRYRNSLWEISTRCLSLEKNTFQTSTELDTSQYVEGAWVQSTESQLHAEIVSHQAWTILFVHGNRTNLEISRCHSKAIFDSLQSRTDRSIRMISLSWPSEKPKTVMLPAVLVDEKKELIRSTGIQLAQFMQRLGGDALQAMIGFSFGSSIIGCALHLHNGGEIFYCGQEIHCAPEPSQVSARQCLNLRIGFIAPAMDRCALQSTGEYHRALDSVDQLVNLYNSRDPILRRFRFFDRDRPVAAGFAGLMDTKFEPLAGNTRIRQYDCRSIGASHALTDYCRCYAYEELLANVLGQTITVPELQ